jgi:adhesin transport system outer membrane protein
MLGKWQCKAGLPLVGGSEEIFGKYAGKSHDKSQGYVPSKYLGYYQLLPEPGVETPSRPIIKRPIFKSSIWRGLLFGACLLAPSALVAENIQEAVQAAVAQHPEITRDRASAAAAGHSVDEAFSTFLPRLDVEGAGGYELTDSPTTRATDVNTRGLVRSEGSFTMTQRVFDGFDTLSRVKAARARAKAADTFAGETVHRISLLAATLYLDVLRNKAFTKSALWNAGIHLTLVGQVRELKQSGRGVGTDVDQAETRVALAQTELEKFRGDVNVAQSRYREVVGKEADELSRPKNPDYQRPATIDEAVASAEASHPRIQTAAGVRAARQADVTTAQANYYPQVNLEAVGTTTGNKDGVPSQDSDFNGRVRGSYNIFNGLGDLARVRGSEKLVEVASAEVREAKRLTRENVRVAYEQGKTAERRLKPLQAQTVAAERVVSGYDKQFKLGQRTLLDLLDAQNELFQARLSEIDGGYRVLLSHYELMSAMGTLPSHFGVSANKIAQKSD